MMIRVEGPDPTAAIRRARDHTPGTVELILEAATALLFTCPLARDDEVHTLKQSRGGAESYGLYLADDREFHFRAGPGRHDARSIVVYTEYKNHGDPIATLTSLEDVRRFFGGLVSAVPVT